MEEYYVRVCVCVLSTQTFQGDYIGLVTAWFIPYSWEMKADTMRTVQKNKKKTEQ